MDFSSTIEDPRHTPGKRHGYAKEQCQAFTNNNQKSLLSSFITTPPVVKPQNYFTGCNISDANKFYQNKYVYNELTFIRYKKKLFRI